MAADPLRHKTPIDKRGKEDCTHQLLNLEHTRTLLEDYATEAYLTH